MLENRLWQYVLKYDPFATKIDVVSIDELNEWDLLIKFRDGKKVIYDTYTNYYKEIFYNDIDELTDEQEKKEFAYRLRSIMSRNHITQYQLAELTNTSQVMISRYVRGESVPSAIVLRRIAKILNCSMDDFFYRQY